MCTPVTESVFLLSLSGAVESTGWTEADKSAFAADH
jgi:hypothetical protein